MPSYCGYISNPHAWRLLFQKNVYYVVLLVSLTYFHPSYLTIYLVTLASLVKRFRLIYLMIKKKKKQLSGSLLLILRIANDPKLTKCLQVSFLLEYLSTQ